MRGCSGPSARIWIASARSSSLTAVARSPRWFATYQRDRFRERRVRVVEPIERGECVAAVILDARAVRGRAAEPGDHGVRAIELRECTGVVALLQRDVREAEIRLAADHVLAAALGGEHRGVERSLRFVERARVGRDARVLRFDLGGQRCERDLGRGERAHLFERGLVLARRGECGDVRERRARGVDLRA